MAAKSYQNNATNYGQCRPLTKWLHKLCQITFYSLITDNHCGCHVITQVGTPHCYYKQVISWGGEGERMSGLVLWLPFAEQPGRGGCLDNILSVIEDIV